MKSNVFEWLRAADLKPDNEMVTTRIAAVAELDTKIREEGGELLLGAVAAVIGGWERSGVTSGTFDTVLACVHAQTPAFSSAIAENGLHLRILCALGLSELLHSEEATADDKLLTSSLLMSGLGLKPREVGQHLNRVFDELESFSRRELQYQAVASRERTPPNWDTLNTLTTLTGDLNKFCQKLIPTIRELFDHIQNQHRIDREELEVMWWLHNGYSDRLGRAVKSATPALAATAIGVELADRIAPPATIGLLELVTQATLRDLPAADSTARPLGRIVADLGEIGRKLLAPSHDDLKDFVRRAGSLFPLTWLFMRLEESRGAIGWEAEFLAQTGVAPNRELTPGELARQAFVERQSQRVYSSSVSETT